MIPISNVSSNDFRVGAISHLPNTEARQPQSTPHRVQPLEPHVLALPSSLTSLVVRMCLQQGKLAVVHKVKAVAHGIANPFKFFNSD